MTRSYRIALVVLCILTALGAPATQAQGNISTAAGSQWVFTNNFSPTPFAAGSGPALSAPLGYVRGIAVDTQGNYYIADTNNNRVRKVTVATGIITTIAGNGTAGFSGDGGTAAPC
jgi:hypothetical protein